MGFDFKKLLGSVAPMLGTAFGGPLGGAAASMLVSKLGLQIDPKNDKAVADAVAEAAMTSDGLLKLKQAEMEFQQNMAELGFKNDSDIAKINAEDRANARDREIKTGDKATPRVLASIVVVAWVTVQTVLLFHIVDTSMRELVARVLGTLDAALMLVLGYYFGSSAGSASKDSVIANIGEKK